MSRLSSPKSSKWRWIMGSIAVGLLVICVAPILILMGLAASLNAEPRSETGQAEQIKVTGGVIEGVCREDGIRVFKGVPFAEPPVGNLRWKFPQPVKPWEGVKQAKAYGPAPVQDDLSALIGVPKGRSEDCLYLNVWTPAKKSDEKLPVMVWIHGGAFTMGSTSQTIYDGSRLAEKGIVVVSVGYRVGSFGFLAHPELTREGGGSSGNYGLRDMVAGLEWVRENAAAFGGDPQCVTIFGESAGGQAVSMLTASPKAKGLFHRAISQSGGSFAPPKTAAGEGFHIVPTLEVAEKDGEAFLTKIKAKDIAAARTLSAEAIQKGGASVWPVFDGDVLPGDQYENYLAGKFNDTPILVGTNSDDGGTFIPFGAKRADFIAQVKQGFGEHAEKLLAVYPHKTDAEASRSAKDLVGDVIFRWHTWAWAKLQSEKGNGKAFVYYFDHPAGGAGHAAELPFIFRNLPLAFLSKKPKAQDTKLSDLMSDYWVNFAKTGDPNGGDLPDWSAFTAKGTTVMTFDTKPAMQSLPHPERLEALDAYFAWRREQAKN